MAVAGAFQVATSDLIQQVRDRLDISGSQNPQDTAILAMLNQSVKRYYDLVVEAYGTDYFFNTYTLTTVANQAIYPMPVDYYKIRFVDLLFGSPNFKVPIRPFPEELRDSYGFGSPQYIPAGQQLIISYTPKAPTLVQYAALSLQTADGVDNVTFQSQIPGLSGTALSLVVATGGTAGTASAAASGLNVILTLGTGVTAGQVVAAIQANPAVFALMSATASQPADLMIQSSLSATALGGNVQYDFINGWERLPIADTCAQVAARLDLDPSPFLAEKAELREEIAMLAQTRDSGHSMEIKDEEAEDIGGWPWAAPTIRGFRYRTQNNNLWLVALVPALPTI